jgi:hypothetical protein
MTTTQSCLVAELTDLLKQLGTLNALSLELQFEGEDLIEYRHCLNKCIELAADSAAKTEDPIYPRDYKLYSRRNLFPNIPLLTIYDLKNLTIKVVNRFEDVYLAYQNDHLKLLHYFLCQLRVRLR